MYLETVSFTSGSVLAVLKGGYNIAIKILCILNTLHSELLKNHFSSQMLVDALNNWRIFKTKLALVTVAHSTICGL